jgi:hypothetical protein
LGSIVWISCLAPSGFDTFATRHNSLDEASKRQQLKLLQQQTALIEQQFEAAAARREQQLLEDSEIADPASGDVKSQDSVSTSADAAASTSETNESTTSDVDIQGPRLGTLVDVSV